MDPIDDVVFSKRLKKPKGDITLFLESARHIRIVPPPPNASFLTGKDLLIIQGSTFLRGDGLTQSFKKHDKDPSFSIKRYMDIFGLDYNNKEIEKLIKESSILITEQKNKFNRPRPIQLAPYFGVEFEVLGSKSSKTPSYPSGHSVQSRLIAEVYGEKYPQHKINLIRAAEECGSGRISAGLHYPADHKVGISYAKRLFKNLKSRKGKTKIKYDVVFDLTTEKGGK